MLNNNNPHPCTLVYACIVYKIHYVVMGYYKQHVCRAFLVEALDFVETLQLFVVLHLSICLLFQEHQELLLVLI